MKKLIAHTYIFFVYICLVHPVRSEILVRPATLADIPEVLELDRRASFEYFKPLYTKAYAHLSLGKNPDYFLELDLKQDEQTFYELVKTPGDTRLHIAYDGELKRVAGLIVFHKEHEDIVELDLLLVDKDYRRMGIGKKLVRDAIATFKNIKTCLVYPIQHANNETLRFYQSMGFKNMGVGPENKKNIYGIKYSEMHFHFRFDL